ncbi:hypothetical protein S245_013393 [Arachis hypogaea]
MAKASIVQRFLLVAVIVVAVSESKKNRQIWNLKKSVELKCFFPQYVLRYILKDKYRRYTSTPLSRMQ